MEEGGGVELPNLAVESAPVEEILEASAEPPPHAEEEPPEEAVPSSPQDAGAAAAVEAPAAPAAEEQAGEGVPAPIPLVRTRAEIVAEVPGGRLTYYGRGFFTATCDNAMHGKCIKTCSAFAGRKRAQGRPLGFLSAWLSCGSDLPSKAAHWDRSNWPDFATRCEHRDMLAEVPGGPDLLAQERPMEPGEAAEPDGLP